jgi:hypothetical protein
VNAELALQAFSFMLKGGSLFSVGDAAKTD